MKTRFASPWFGVALLFGAVMASAATNPLPTAAPVVVTITAPDPIADETGPSTGLFTVWRTGATVGPLTVSYRTSGTAVNGVDYVKLPGSVTIPAGADSASFLVTPIDDKIAEEAQTVVVTLISPIQPLAPNSLYEIGRPSSATVIINDVENVSANQPPVVKITSPGNGQSFPALTDILISAAASDPDGTVLTVEFFANGKSLGVKTNNPASASPVNPFQLTWKKVPAGHYSLTAKAVDNQGLATTSAAVQISVVEVIAGESLIPFGAVWKYLDNGTDQRTAWQGLTFNDSKWASGPAKLGYGEGDEATVVSFGPDPKHKYVTTYFRHAFTVQNASRYTNLQERILRDDGAIVYLNGTEISHGNMPTGTVTNGTFALSELTGTAKSVYHLAKVDPKLLVNGKNVIAVEVHQASLTGPDISFDFELTSNAQVPGTTPPPQATLVINSPKNAATFTAPAEIAITATAIDPKGYISRVEFLANNQSIGVSDIQFFRAPDPGTPIQHLLDWRSVPVGKYTLTATAKDAAGAVVNSAPITVTVTAAPTLTLTPQGQAAGLRVSFPGESGRVYRIQSSSDLINWADLGTAETRDGTVELLDNAPSGAHRFYRAIPVE
jgi:Bacterial Ig domain/Calx-beta domain